jgi:hypothetical protein
MKFKQFYIEKTIIGLVEEITIDELGPVPCKVDSGNGAYNVLHGENIKLGEGTVKFDTVHGKTIQKDVVDTIVINVGAGNTEERPIVLFDIKLGDKIFKGVKFSIGNRTANEYPVLISATFIKELDALIDISQKHIFSQNISVDL